LKKHTSITAQLPPLFQAPPPLLPPSNESGLIQDLKDFAERLIPSRYHHDDRCGDNNGFSHLRATPFGPSIVTPIENGEAFLGTWQEVILIDFDNRPRTREIILHRIGELE
jgi:secondary thiamine-phosphate synthase enzyme